MYRRSGRATFRSKLHNRNERDLPIRTPRSNREVMKEQASLIPIARFNFNLLHTNTQHATLRGIRDYAIHSSSSSRRVSVARNLEKNQERRHSRHRKDAARESVPLIVTEWIQQRSGHATQRDLPCLALPCRDSNSSRNSRSRVSIDTIACDYSPFLRFWAFCPLDNAIHFLSPCPPSPPTKSRNIQSATR